MSELYNEIVEDLVFASECGDIEEVKALLAEGADVNAKDNDGSLPLCAAILCKQTAVVRFLLENGADVYKSDGEGWTPFGLAASGGHIDIVKMFLEFGADANKVDEYGYTPLTYAHGTGRTKIVELLEDAKRKKIKDEQMTDKAQTPVVQTDIEKPYVQNMNSTPIRVSCHTAKTMPNSTVWMTFVHTKED